VVPGLAGSDLIRRLRGVKVLVLVRDSRLLAMMCPGF
jgi:hypothetical protein